MAGLTASTAELNARSIIVRHRSPLHEEREAEAYLECRMVGTFVLRSSRAAGQVAPEFGTPHLYESAHLHPSSGAVEAGRSQWPFGQPNRQALGSEGETHTVSKIKVEGDKGWYCRQPLAATGACMWEHGCMHPATGAHT